MFIGVWCLGWSRYTQHKHTLQTRTLTRAPDSPLRQQYVSPFQNAFVSVETPLFLMRHIAMWTCTAEDQLRCQAEQALLRDSRTSSFAAVATSENLVCNAAERAFASGYVMPAVIKRVQPRPSSWYLVRNTWFRPVSVYPSPAVVSLYEYCLIA